VSRGQKYVLPGKTPAGIGIHRACEDSGMDAEDLRLAVYRAFAETGRAPEPGELATELVLDLGTLWRLAAHWYDGRLDRGYVRREPSQATAYLRGVGLAGPFWGL